MPAPTYSNACPDVLTVLTLFKFASLSVVTLITPGKTFISKIPPNCKFNALIAPSTMSSSASRIAFLSAR